MTDTGAATTTATVESILTNSWWRWGCSTGNAIQFFPNGEGELLAGYDQTYFLFNKFTWKPCTEKDILALKQTVPSTGTDFEFPSVEIEFAMNNDRVKGFETWLNSINTAAFHPKKCTLTLKRGTFPVLGQDCTDLCSWYSEHLHMDPSPYPANEAWEDRDIADGLKPFERKDFYRTEVEGDEYWDPETGRTRAS